MKPISFAAISFLAITVSAKLPCTNPYQYLHSPSSTTTQSPQHSGQSKVEAELARLTAAYEKEKESVAPIEAKSNIDRQNAIDAGNRMNSIVDRLEELNIDDAGKSELWRKYYEAKVEWVDLAARHNKQYRHYIKIRKERDDAQMALDLLLKNQELIRDYNDKHDVKTGPSHNSCYNLVFLREQIDHIPKEIRNLLAEWGRIKADKRLSKDSLRTWKAEHKDAVRRRKKRCEIVKDILREHEQNRPIGAQVREVINLFLPNGQI